MDPLVALSSRTIKNGSLSFATAARLLPPGQRASTQMLYAWCRHCDDEIDGQTLGHDWVPDQAHSSEARLAQLRAKTLDALAGRATEPVFQGLQRVVAAHEIPARHPLDLIEGMAMDVHGHRCQSIDDTLLYAYHVAGVVGVMMALIMGVREPATLARASDLGIAFQLTNITRDILADAKMGRIYLPADWLDELGVPPDRILERRYRGELTLAARRLLDVADGYYSSAANGIAQLPLRSAWAIGAARRIYYGIGAKVRRQGVTAWDQRASTGRLSKLANVGIAGVEALAMASNRRPDITPSRQGLWTPHDLRAS